MRDRILEFLLGDEGFSPHKFIEQEWQTKSYSYIDMPRPDHGLMLLTHGEISFVFSGGSLAARAGDLVFLPQGARYEARFATESGSVRNYLVNFESRAESPAREPTLLAHSSYALADVFLGMVHSGRYASHTPLYKKGELYLLFDSVVTLCRQPPSDNERILERACALLRDEDVKVAEVARRLAVSESVLRRIFVESLGVSPVKYRLGMRLERAAYMLECGNMTISEIADGLGFFDTAYFCRSFKAHFGKTPSEYAKKRRL